jgi:hypothetical protein
MFTPFIDLEVLNKATILRFTDVTTEDTGDGTKWDGIGGISTLDVSTALLTVTDPNGDISTLDVTAEINASWPVIGMQEIEFDDITGEWIDGYYSVQYDVWMVSTNIVSLTDYGGGYIQVNSVAHGVQTGMKVTIEGTVSYDGFYDAIRIDADNYYFPGTYVADEFVGTSYPCYSNTFSPFVFANIEMAVTRMFATFCNMDEGPEADEYMNQVDLCHGLLLGLRSALMTSTTERINNIYGRILRILDYNEIELTYT